MVVDELNANSALAFALKCHYDQILDTHFFTFSIRTQQVFPRYLAKFQSITNIRTRGFWTFISKNLRPPLISLVPSLGENWTKWRHFLKNTTRVEIIAAERA